MAAKTILDTTLEALQSNPTGFNRFIQNSPLKCVGAEICPRTVYQNGKKISEKPNTKLYLALQNAEECVAAHIHIDGDEIKLDMHDFKHRKYLGTKGDFVGLNDAEALRKLAIVDDSSLDESRKAVFCKTYKLAL